MKLLEALRKYENCPLCDRKLEPKMRAIFDGPSRIFHLTNKEYPLIFKSKNDLVYEETVFPKEIEISNYDTISCKNQCIQIYDTCCKYNITYLSGPFDLKCNVEETAKYKKYIIETENETMNIYDKSYNLIFSIKNVYLRDFNIKTEDQLEDRINKLLLLK